MWRRARGVALALGAMSTVLMLAGSLPTTALAATTDSATAGTSQSPLVEPFVDVSSLQVLPAVRFASGLVRFHANGLAALTAAEHAPKMIALHRREHPLIYSVRVWVGSNPLPHWAVDFSYRGSEVAEVDVSRFGRVTAVWTGPLAVYLAGRGHYGGLFDSPWVVITFSVLFLVPFLGPRRVRPLRVIDGLLLLAAFVIPYYLFDHAHLEAAVLVVYPLLILLLARMLALGWSRNRRAGAEPPAWPISMLAVGVLALVAARVVLDIVDPNVIDVGVASVAGAHAIAAGQPLYSALAAAHGDTYGPITYLAYLPFEAIWPWHGVWNYLPAAHAAAIFFDVATTVALVVLGMRLRSGGAGKRLGLTLAWAWAAYPATLLGLMSNANDGLVALLFVLVLLVFTSAVGRGVVLGLVAAAKLFPVVLVPLFAFGWRTRRIERALVVGVVFGLVVVAAFAGFIPSGGLHELYERTIGFQLDRFDVFSVWGLHPSLGWAKTIVEIFAGALAVGVALIAHRRSVAGVAALAAAVTIAVQLPAEHWFFNYLMWVAPFALVAVFAREWVPSPARPPAPADPGRPAPVRVERVLAAR